MMAVEQRIPEWLETGLQCPVAILGWGRSGKAAARLIERLGGSIVVYDEGIDGPIRNGFGEASAGTHSIAICSPGFGSEHPWVVAARKSGCRTIAEFDLGAALWKGPIIAITGTNGKTTLASFLHEAFQKRGIDNHVMGNIGEPMCEILLGDCNPETLAICEISSFQAEQIEFLRADHILWTNFDEDHLDRHGSMSSYFRSKYRLIESMRGDTVFVGPSVFEFGQSIGIDLPPASIVEEDADPVPLGLVGSVFETQPEMRSYLMARSLWQSLQLEEALLARSARAFGKSPHRVEFLGEARGMRFWNDSKATNFHAVYGALDRFEHPVYWIGGGKDKGGNIGNFAKRIAPKIRSAATLGETGERLRDELRSNGVSAERFDSIEDAVTRLSNQASDGDNVVLSPGFASFDMFESYSDRGEVFRKAIDCLRSERSTNDD